MSDAALLSTAGIQDPQTRNFLDRLVQVWDQRLSGDDRLVKRSELDQLSIDAMVQALSGGVIGGAGGSLKASIDNAIHALSDSIRRSLVMQVLESGLNLPDLQSLRNEVATGMSREEKTRTNDDSVLASAINRIWGYIGGSTAVIEEGSLATANPSAAVATKWSSVVAAVTDPNTGNVNSAAILSETRAYASSADSSLNAIYSVKAQVASGGATVVGGFALAATSGAGSAQGPTIDFGVLANKFFIAAPSSSYNPATEYSTNTDFPFIVVTTPTTINGVTYPAGVYMKKAAIGHAAIGSAEIEDLAVSTAKISQHLASNNFNGTFDGSGNIATNGTLGWAIDKSGNLVSQNAYIRGDIQATSLTANTVTATNIVGGAVSSLYIGQNTTGGASCSVVVVVPSGATGLVVNVEPGSTYNAGTGGKDGTAAAYTRNYGWFDIDGTNKFSTAYAVLAPAAGTYTFTAHRFLPGGDVTGMYITVMVAKK